MIEIFLSIEINAIDKLAIATTMMPSSTSGDGTSNILSNNFPGTNTLYIVPLAGFTKLPTLSFQDVTLDRLADWKLLPVRGMTSQGVVVDVTGFAPSIYPFKIIEKLSFWDVSLKNPQIVQAVLPDTDSLVNFQKIVPSRQDGLNFKLLKTDRETMGMFLEEQKDNKVVCQKLAPEIYQALMAETFSVPSSQWELLKDEYTKTHAAFKQLLVMSRKITLAEVVDVHIQEAQLNHVRLKLEEIQDQLMDYCSRPKVYQSYVEHLKEKGEVGYLAVLIYAKMANVSIFFWENDPERPHHLKLIEAHDGGESVSLTLHFEVSGYTHFDVLVPDNVSVQSLYGNDTVYSFTVTNGDPIYISDPLPEPPPVKVQPSYYFTYDHWNNITKVIDTLGNTTDHTYNFGNQRITQTQPAVYIVEPKGNIITGRPVTKYGYNIRGFKIGETDPNGNTQAHLLDSAGQEVGWRVGDGLLVRIQNFNALGQRECHTDARGYNWQYLYNHLNSVVQITYPSLHTEYFLYNELNYRTVDVDQIGNSTQYDHDPQGNVCLRIEPCTKYATQMIFDRNNKMTVIHNPDGTSMYWTRDYFGKEQQHSDLAGVPYFYSYDWKGQKISQYSNGGRMSYKGVVTKVSEPWWEHFPWNQKNKTFYFCIPNCY